MPHINCRFCGVQLEYDRGRPPVKCGSADCRRAYMAEAMRNYRAKTRSGPRTKDCQECGTAFPTDRRKANKRFCSEVCGRTAHLRRRRDREYRPPVKFCAYCAKEIEYKSGRQRFCSDECQRADAARDARWKAKRVDPAVVGLALRCALCGTADRALDIDHDHECCKGERTCGQCFRGMLCRPCNVGLGMFKESPALLRKAARYITEARRARSKGAQSNLF